MPYMPCPSFFIETLSTERLLNSLHTSHNRFALASITWDEDVYDLPPEMRWYLPVEHVVQDFSEGITSVYDLKGTKDAIQDDLEDVLGRMGNVYEDVTSDWGTQSSQNEVRLAVFLSECC